MKKHYANIISLTGLSISLIVIILVNYEIIRYEYLLAASGLYMILDLFDGTIARKYCKDKKDLVKGELIDSLSDLINFGVIPFYGLLLKYDQFEYLTLLGIIFILSSVYRLARFSAIKDDTPGVYIGLPITIAGPVWLIIIITSNNLPFAIVTGVLLSYLMISSVKVNKLYIKFNKKEKRWAGIRKKK